VQTDAKECRQRVGHFLIVWDIDTEDTGHGYSFTLLSPGAVCG
jgi:hypothetical protein